MQILKKFQAEAIIFDKDGTLIDFDAMWGNWTLQLAERLQAVTSLDIHQPLCESYGYDLVRHKVRSDGKLTCTPMWQLRELVVAVVKSRGLSTEEAACAVEKAWCVPDPVRLARPFTDTQQLFTNIHKLGTKIAIATTDDRTPTESMLEAFGVYDLVTTMVCADDGIPAKPAPDMVMVCCERMQVDPAKVIVVGDTVADLQMARAAGAGYVVGVLSGVGSLPSLTPLADILIDTIDTLQDSFTHTGRLQTPRVKTDESLLGWNPDPAYA